MLRGVPFKVVPMPSYNWKIDAKPFYSAKAQPALVELPPQNVFAIDGQGDPNTSPDFALAVQALYQLSYTLKFYLKKDGYDYGIAPLEGLWDFRDGPNGHTSEPAAGVPKDQFVYTLFITQPPFITPDHLKTALGLLTEKAQKKKEAPNPRWPEVRFEVLTEGKCAQILHTGSYDAEPATVEKLHTFIESSGLEIAGLHHEIYLTMPDTADEKKKTIIRYPVAPAGL